VYKLLIIMKTIKQILIDGPETNYTGSELTRSIVEKEVEARWGKAEIKNLDLKHNVRTFSSWLACGWRVRPKEKAIKSVTYVERKDPEGNIVKKYSRPVFLFTYRQVDKIGPENV
jgi:hypothetical protein